MVVTFQDIRSTQKQTFSESTNDYYSQVFFLLLHMVQFFTQGPLFKLQPGMIALKNINKTQTSYRDV